MILAVGLLLSPLRVISPPVHAVPYGSPELVPFVGNFKITATWGRPSGGYHSEPALDIQMDGGTRVYAAGAGQATAVIDNRSCNPANHMTDGTLNSGVTWCIRNGFANSGTRVAIVHPDGRKSVYLHLSSVIPALSDADPSPVPVAAGQLIGYSGNTGISTGPHLHYEERDAAGNPIDPGTMVGCQSGARVDYTGLQNRVNTYLSNDSMSCARYEGMIIRRSDGVSWVVQGGRRYHIADFATDVCAVYVRNLPVLAGLTYSQANELPEDSANYKCDLNGAVLQARDGGEPRPSFRFHDNKRYSIPDAQTWKYWTITRGARQVPAPRSVITDPRLVDGGTEPAKLYAPDWEGKIIRRSDGVSWVVLGGKRHHLPNYATDVCAQYVQGRTVRGGFADSQTSSIPEDSAYTCDLNGHILRASNQPDPKPSFVYRDNARYWLRDPWTYDYFVRRGFSVVDMPHAAITDDRLADGGTETPKLDPQSIPINTIIRRNDGVSWVVDSNRVRHHIPYSQDDVCWRNLGGRGFGPTSVSARDLTYDQARQLPEADAWPCIIGNRVVRSDDGSSWFVDTNNSRHWIPDTDTYAVLARSNPVSGPWSAGDVNQIPRGSDRPAVLDPEAVKNTLVCRNDNVCWAVDGSGVRHHIPTYADNVCWRWVYGWHVSRNNVTYDQGESLPEADPWGCNMNNYVVATNEGPAYYMEGNTRRWIPDGYDFECLQRGRTVIRGMSLSEASGIPEGGAMPAQECAGIDIVTIRSAYNNKVVTTEINYGGNDYGMVRAGRDSVGSYWEMFRLIGDCYSGAGCLIQSLNNRKLVLAQFDYQGYAWGELRGASGNAAGSWEHFRLEGNCATGCAIRALGWTGDTRYVSAEFGYTGAGYGMLRARATGVSGWERFIIQ